MRRRMRGPAGASRREALPLPTVSKMGSGPGFETGPPIPCGKRINRLLRAGSAPEPHAGGTAAEAPSEQGDASGPSAVSTPVCTNQLDPPSSSAVLSLASALLGLSAQEREQLAALLLARGEQRGPPAASRTTATGRCGRRLRRELRVELTPPHRWPGRGPFPAGPVRLSAQICSPSSHALFAPRPYGPISFFFLPSLFYTYKPIFPRWTSCWGLSFDSSG
jgi:hypothetical protein